jgi:hypothetical protein
MLKTLKYQKKFVGVFGLGHLALNIKNFVSIFMVVLNVSSWNF